MAANKQTLKLPNKVVDSSWRDDINTSPDTPIDYAIYGDSEGEEGEYISPASVRPETAEQIKQFQIKLAFGGLKKFRQQELRAQRLATV